MRPPNGTMMAKREPGWRAISTASRLPSARSMVVIPQRHLEIEQRGAAKGDAQAPARMMVGKGDDGLIAESTLFDAVPGAAGCRHEGFLLRSKAPMLA